MNLCSERGKTMIKAIAAPAVGDYVVCSDDANEEGDWRVKNFFGITENRAIALGEDMQRDCPDGLVIVARVIARTKRTLTRVDTGENEDGL
jgi:hypothetical protein